jgi:two-component system, OmpR family, phosphate regulon sensor histidine kinase PhoR
MKKRSERALRLNEIRLSTLLRLYEKKKELTREEVCDFVLESALSLTGSTIGFLGFVPEDESVMHIYAWSDNVMNQCAIRRAPIEFRIAEAGLWGEAVRNRRPVVINDFSAPSPLKKGTPEGHVTIRRFLAVPLLYNSKVAAVLAAGNKTEEYDGDDIDQLRLLLEGMWQILLRKDAEEELVRNAWKLKHFANAIAHDLKNPAVAAFGLARRLRERYGDAMDEQGARYCELIMQYAEQIALLATDINTYLSFQEHGRDVEALRLDDLWETIRLEFGPRLEFQKVRWSEPDVPPPEIEANKIDLLRVLRNLVDNALKYGGDTLSEITVGYEAGEEHHILKVQNDGRVILPENERIIFEEFTRKADTPQICGTGLGLAIVREIARRYRGDSWLSTTSDGKTVFFVSIARHLSC